MKNPIPLNKRPTKPFCVRSPQDLTLAEGLRRNFGCSRATILRTIKHYNIPTWHFIEIFRGTKFFSKFNLYKFLPTPMFAKYFKRLSTYADIPNVKKNINYTTLAEVQTKLDLTATQLDQGVKSGIIPCARRDEELLVPDWFLPAVERVYPCF